MRVDRGERHKARASLAAIAVLMLGLGCAGAPRFDTAALPATELVDVPFFPQTDYQCGPAALATVLVHAGLPVSPEQLAPDVYIEGLEGSLQAELLGATRRQGLVPYQIEPDPAKLFAEVESGRPVLVLQNLGVARLPIWHYAVVVGFDSDRGRVLLRSGTEERRSEPIRRFLRSWELADHWGFVAAGPEPPATATPALYVRALAGASSVLPPDAADAAYTAAAERWPRDTLVLFATAGRHASNERWDEAADVYETLLEIEPEHAAARNNFANVRAEQGCPGEALRQAREALSLAAPDSPLRGAILDTVETIEASGTGEADLAHCRA